MGHPARCLRTHGTKVPTGRIELVLSDGINFKLEGLRKTN